MLRPRSRRRLVLVTGGGGFVGRHLLERLSAPGWETVAPSSAALDVSRSSTVEAIRDWKPAVVVHLAYRKGDPASIVDGSRYVARGAAAAGARLVHVSTDIVFAGRTTPYTEADVPDPIIPYGEQKAAAERAVAEECPSAVSVRTSLVYGTDHVAPVQLDVRRALADGPERRPMTFFTDEVRCPVHATDLADALLALAALPEVTGPLHVAGPDDLTRADFARLIAVWSGLDPDRLSTATVADSGTVRPAHVVLDSSAAGALGISCRSAADVLVR